MPELVDLDQVKARLQYDHDADDDDLQALLEAASEMVLSYLKLDSDYYDGEDVPGAVQTAVIMLVGILKRDPSMREANTWQPGYLPAPVTAILYPLRDPTLA
jgi:hypothetical protein